MIEKVYSGDLDTAWLAKTLQDRFTAEGYKVQKLGAGQDVAVQIRKESTKRAIVGLEQAPTVRMQKNGGTSVSLGQAKWADKVGVEVIGFMAFWPLMIPATYGIYEQNKLPGRILKVVDDTHPLKVPLLLRKRRSRQ